MSMILYLNAVVTQEILKAMGKESDEVKSGMRTEYRGFVVNTDADRRFIYYVKKDDAPDAVLIPFPFRGFVESISWRVVLPTNCIGLVLGRYEFGSAAATVVRDASSNLVATISGPELKAIRDLYSRLRTGRIRSSEPWATAGETPSKAVSAGDSVKFACANCGANYMVSRSKVGHRTVKYRCGQCSAMINIDAAMLAAYAAAAEAPSEHSGEQPDDPTKLPN